MNFLIDAQLPRRLARLLTAAGHDAMHTLDLPNANKTTDAEINAVSIQEKRVVITKDSDFVDSFLLAKEPYKLLLLSTGNISNKELEALFAPLIPAIAATFQSHDYAELTRTALIVHV
jgi:predicted nuclease of predicted toxin-antitoxin system